jgi:hypothetical protein
LIERGDVLAWTELGLSLVELVGLSPSEYRRRFQR